MAGADEADLLPKDKGTKGRSGEGEGEVAELKLRQCYSEAAQPVSIPLTMNPRQLNGYRLGMFIDFSRLKHLTLLFFRHSCLIMINGSVCVDADTNLPLCG